MTACCEQSVRKAIPMAHPLEQALKEELNRLIEIRREEVETQAAIAIKFWAPPLLNHLANALARLNLPKRLEMTEK
jgi:hypothetical protein